MNEAVEINPFANEPTHPSPANAGPVAWRVDGKRNGKPEIWFYYKPEWPQMHEEHGDTVTPLYAAPVIHAQCAPTPSDEMVETACAAYAKATDYYVEFHRGLSSASADRMRVGMRAALSALTSPESQP